MTPSRRRRSTKHPAVRLVSDFWPRLDGSNGGIVSLAEPLKLARLAHFCFLLHRIRSLVTEAPSSQVAFSTSTISNFFTLPFLYNFRSRCLALSPVLALLLLTVKSLLIEYVSFTLLSGSDVLIMASFVLCL